MANQKDRKRINVKGGGLLYARELDPTPSNTYVELGYLDSSELDDMISMVGDIDEAGILPNSVEGSQVAKFRTVLKQSSADEINFLRNATGKFLELYYRVLLANGYYQEVSIPLARVNPSVNLKFAAGTERKISVEFFCLAPKAAYTRGVTAFNVVKDQPYVLIDGASATFNTSNTEASALAAAVL